MPTAGSGSRNERTLAAYEAAADLYRATAPGEVGPESAAFLEELVALAPGGSVLELGSGPGVDARYLESRGLSVTRTDATRAFVDRLREDGVDACRLNLLSDELGGPYDAVYAGAVLLHLDAQQLHTALVKARAAARVLAFTVKEGDGDEWTSARLDVPRWFRYWRADELRDAVMAAGWDVRFVRHVPGRRRDAWLQVLAS